MDFPVELLKRPVVSLRLFVQFARCDRKKFEMYIYQNYPRYIADDIYDVVTEELRKYDF
jgi:hypothetical protein